MFQSRLLLLAVMLLISVNLVYAQDVAINEDLRNDGVIDFLPLLKEQTIKAGVKPPRPFFISPYFFMMDDEIMLSNLKTKLHTPDGITIEPPEGTITIDNTNVKNNTFGVRAGIWVLPFWSIYGMYGYSIGTASVDVKTKVPAFEQYIKAVGNKLDIVVNTWAVGTTAAYGMKDVLFNFDIFANIDLNYSWSNVNILDNDLNMIVFSPRIGISRNLPYKMNLATWIGGMYKDDSNSSSNVSGRYSLGDGVYSSFSATKRFVSPWNMVVGALFQTCDWFSIMAEFGFLNRLSFNTGLQFHF